MRRALLPFLALALGGCAPNQPTAVLIQSRTEQGLLQLPREIATARVGTLNGKGTSAYFTSSIIPATASTVHTQGRLQIARGTALLTFLDRDGQTRTVRATPAAPGEWTADIRTLRPRDNRNGFLLNLSPLEGQPPTAEGIELSVTYGPG